MHQKPDVIRIQVLKVTLTIEVSNDQFHQWCILFLQKLEWKNPAQLPQIPRSDVRLIISSIQLLSLIPFLTNVRYPSHLRNSLWCQSEGHSSKIYMTIMQM